jgi:hypothetical protein
MYPRGPVTHPRTWGICKSTPPAAGLPPDTVASNLGSDTTTTQEVTKMSTQTTPIHSRSDAEAIAFPRRGVRDPSRK